MSVCERAVGPIGIWYIHQNWLPCGEHNNFGLHKYQHEQRLHVLLKYTQHMSVCERAVGPIGLLSFKDITIMHNTIDNMTFPLPFLPLPCSAPLPLPLPKPLPFTLALVKTFALVIVATAMLPLPWPCGSLNTVSSTIVFAVNCQMILSSIWMKLRMKQSFSRMVGQTRGLQSYYCLTQYF